MSPAVPMRVPLACTACGIQNPRRRRCEGAARQIDDSGVFENLSDLPAEPHLFHRHLSVGSVLLTVFGLLQVFFDQAGNGVVAQRSDRDGQVPLRPGQAVDSDAVEKGMERLVAQLVAGHGGAFQQSERLPGQQLPERQLF